MPEELAKYDKKGPFMDPVSRCCDCQTILSHAQVQKLGMCPNCGNKRIRNVLVMSEDEMADLKEKGVDPDFLALFEGVDDDAAA